MRFRSLLAAAALPAALLSTAGCSLSGGIARHSVAYNTTVEWATDGVLLLNILRARDRMPLHFSAIAAIHGALGLSAGFGYDLSAASVNNTLPAILGFDASEVRDWIGERTARCPRCGINAVLSARAAPIDPVFLRRMRAHWFERAVRWDPSTPWPPCGGA